MFLSSSLRRTLVIAAVLAIVSLPLGAGAAQAGPLSRHDSSPIVRFEIGTVLKGLWSSFTHFLELDTARIDPNGGGVVVLH